MAWDGVLVSDGEEVETMTMYKTPRNSGRPIRQVLAACKLAALLLGIAAAGQLQADERPGARTAPFPPPPGGATGGGPQWLPGTARGETVYHEGDIVYEGSDGTFMPADGGFFGGGGEGYENMGCPPSWVATAEIVFLTRESDSQSSLSSAFRLDDFGDDPAGRVTIAHRFDCLMGWEASYMGPFVWEQFGAATGTGLATVAVPFGGVNLSAFNNAVFQQESYTTRMQSAEFSQKWWGWDVITTSAGMRFINVEEDLRFNSVNAAAESGTFSIDTNNRLLGGQIGMDLLFPVGRVGTTTRLRGGAYANFMDTNVLLTNAGVTQVNTAAEEIDFAATLEIGYYVSYHITPNIVARCGYDVTWLYGLALGNHQTTARISPASGNETDRDGDVFFHGGSAGIEVTW